MKDPNNPNPTITPNPAPAPAPKPAAPERPSWLPEDFESPEAFRAAYDSLKAPKTETPEDDPKQTPAPKGNEDAQIGAFVTGLGFDVDSLTKEVASTGTINPEAMTKIEDAVTKMGLPKEMVQRYIEGEKLKAEQFVNNIHGIAGGKDEFDRMAAWAQRSLPPEDLKAFSDLMESGDAKKAEFAAKALVAQYRGNNRIPGKMLRGGTTAGVDSDIFFSKEEQVAAQMDVRYRTDPAYQRQVIEKIVRTNQSRRS